LLLSVHVTRTLIMSGLAEDDVEGRAREAELRSSLARRHHTVHTVHLPDCKLGYCTGCFGCWTKTPGRCHLNDEADELLADVMGHDVVVLSGRISFGGFCSQLKKGVDRLLPLVSPFFRRYGDETHHLPRYADYPVFFGFGIQAREDDQQEQIFRELVRRTGVDLKAPRAWCCVRHPGDDTDAMEHELDALEHGSQP
jgi:hypothetical protein